MTTCFTVASAYIPGVQFCSSSRQKILPSSCKCGCLEFPILIMLSTFAILLVLGSARLSQSFKGRVTEASIQYASQGEGDGEEGVEGVQTGVSYEVMVLKVYKDAESNLTEDEVITISTKMSSQNGITWLTVGTNYFMTASSSKTIDLCQSYVVEWNSLPLPKRVYKWQGTANTLTWTTICSNCKINYGTPKNEANVCDYDSDSVFHLYERCNYNANLGTCTWDKLPQKESGLDCEVAEVE